MLRMEHPDTNMASTQDWLRRSRDMTISAYEPRTTISNPVTFDSGVVDSPFSATHPSVAGRRNAVRSTDEEAITLGPAQELQPRQHASVRTLLYARKRR